MNDREMFDVLVAQAPTPRPGHEITVLRRARRVRRRRRLAGAGMGVVAVSMVAAIAVAPHPSAEERTAQPGGTRTPSAGTQRLADDSGAYVLAVRTLAESVRGDGPRWRVLYVLDHSCANVVTPADGGCAPRPLPGALREGIVAGLADYAPVRFIRDRESVTGRDLVVTGGGAVVTIGRPRPSGDGLHVALSVVQGGLNGRGLTYKLTRHGDGWKIDGSVGNGWIS